jgi:uncharacterized membrane protein YkgB
MTKQTMRRPEYFAFLFAHFAIFTIFVWFGGLKVLGLSPASPLVSALLAETFPALPEAGFIAWFGVFEVIIGCLFLIPRAEKVAIAVLVVHMITTAGPLFLLPDIAWQSFLAPTLEGQYIIKNIVVVALAATILVDADKRRTK